MIVCKFGGTSLCDADRFFRTAKILQGCTERRVAVPSAPGKRRADDEKITDLLLQCHQAAPSGTHGPLFARVRERFAAIAAGIGRAGLLEAELNAVEAALPVQSLAWTLSRGEYLSGLLLAALLGWTFCDAADAVFFGPDGRCDTEKTTRALREKMPAAGGLVLPGFYGTGADGRIQTFPRGGSDITGAIAAQALGASLYENWTDVPGVMTADPRIVPQARVIPRMSWRQLREMSACGAGVVQEEAVLPAQQAGIPIAVRSSREPDAPGTLILPEESSGVPPVPVVAARAGYVAFIVRRPLLHADPCFVLRALDALRRCGVRPSRLLTGVDLLSLIVPAQDAAGRIEKVRHALSDALQALSVRISPPLALLAIVGCTQEDRARTAARALSALDTASIPVHALECGAGMTLSFFVEEEHADAGVRALFRVLAE